MLRSRVSMALACAALWLGTRALACSVELAPLAARSGDAGSDACESCGDAGVDATSEAPSCPAGHSLWQDGRCCTDSLGVQFPGVTVAGLLLHDEAALVFGKKSTRGWVARVDRCTGSVVREAEVPTNGDAELTSATLAGSKLVAAGVTQSQSLAAWADATTLEPFQVELGDSSPATRTNAIVTESATQVWAAGSSRPGTVQGKATLSRIELSPTGEHCSTSLGNSPGSGQAISIEGQSLVVASNEALSLWLTRASTSSCFPIGCGSCDWGPRQRIDYAPTYTMGGFRRVAGGFVLATTWLENPTSAKAGGGAVLRIGDSFGLDALFTWHPTTQFDWLGPLVLADTSVVVGGGRSCSGDICQAGTLIALPKLFQTGDPTSWERELTAVTRVTGLAPEPETEAGLLVAGTLGASGSALLRCSRLGECAAQ